MVNRNTEQILLGAWLLDEHLEDMKLFKPEDFEYYPTVAKLFMEGVTDHFDLSEQAKVKRSVIIEMTHEYEDSFYEGAMREISQEKAQKWVYDHPKATPSEIAEAMKMFERVVETAPSPSADPVSELQEEFERRRTTPIVSTGITDDICRSKAICG